MWALFGLTAVLTALPFLWLAVAAQSFGFGGGGFGDILRGCIRALLSGEISTLLTLAALFLPAILLWTQVFWRIGQSVRKTKRMLKSLLQRKIALPERLRQLVNVAKLQGRLVLIDDPAIFAFAFGLRKPRVALSSALTKILADDELLAVLQHEAYHLRRRDVLRHLFVDALQKSLGFMPLARSLAEADRLAKELAADRYAGASDPEALASALLRLARLGVTTKVQPAASGELEQRIMALCHGKKRVLSWRPGLLPGLLLSLLLLTAPLLLHANNWLGLELHSNANTILQHEKTTTC